MRTSSWRWRPPWPPGCPAAAACQSPRWRASQVGMLGCVDRPAWVGGTLLNGVWRGSVVGSAIARVAGWAAWCRVGDRAAVHVRLAHCLRRPDDSEHAGHLC